MHPEDDTPEIADRAFAALNEGDLESAQALALQLQKLRYSAYFEIQALIHLDKNELKQAIVVLREGTRQAPDVWLLWQLLGNCLSDSNQFEEAMACYTHALELHLDEEVSASIIFNQATLLSRTNRDNEALALLDSLSPEAGSELPLLQINIELLRLRIWRETNRCDDVAVGAIRLEEQLRSIERMDGDDFRAISEVWSRCSRTLLECGLVLKARAWAQESLEIFVGDQQALEILRLSDPEAPLAKRYFQVLLEGSEGENGFYVSYSVVARDATEAQTLALAMESPSHSNTLAVSKCQPLGKCDKTPIGVYEVGAYNLFPLDAPDE